MKILTIMRYSIIEPFHLAIINKFIYKRKYYTKVLDIQLHHNQDYTIF